MHSSIAAERDSPVGFERASVVSRTDCTGVHFVSLDAVVLEDDDVPVATSLVHSHPRRNKLC